MTTQIADNWTRDRTYVSKSPDFARRGAESCTLLPPSQKGIGTTTFTEKRGAQLKKAAKFKECEGGVNAQWHEPKGFVGANVDLREAPRREKDV